MEEFDIASRLGNCSIPSNRVFGKVHMNGLREFLSPSCSKTDVESKGLKILTKL